MQWKNLQSYIKQENTIICYEQSGRHADADKARVSCHICLPAWQLPPCLPACSPQLASLPAACSPQLRACNSCRSCRTAAASCDDRRVSEPKAC
jgi:hypothetical protein